MYVTYSDLIQIGIFICALLDLCYTNFSREKRKIAAITAIMTAVNKNSCLIYSGKPLL